MTNRQQPKKYLCGWCSTGHHRLCRVPQCSCDCGHNEEVDHDFETAHRDPSLDTASSASRQHYIDTGRYLKVGEAFEG